METGDDQEGSSFMKKTFLLIIFTLITFNLFSEEANDVPERENSVLVGFIVKHGDIIDGVTPIYKQILQNGELGTPFIGNHLGGKGGKESVAVRNLSIVKGVLIERCDYFGANHISRLWIIWQKWSKGTANGDMYISEVYGTGNNASNKQIQDIYFSELGVKGIESFSIAHTSGENYLSNIQFITRNKTQGQKKEIMDSTKVLKKFKFEIKIISGFHEGKKYAGNFTLDTSKLKKQGEEMIEVDSINFVYEGDNYSKDSFDSIPKARFVDGVFQDLFFVGGPQIKRFGLNDGFQRAQFGRDSELFISEGKSYFGYLDEDTYVEGAGTVEYLPEEK